MIEPETPDINSFIEEERENRIGDFKVFMLYLNDITYELILECQSNDKIILKLWKLNNISYFKYTKVYKYEELLTKFKLDKEKFKNIFSLFVYFDKEIIPAIEDLKKDKKTIKLILNKNDEHLYLKEEKISEMEIFNIHCCKKYIDFNIQQLEKKN